MNVLALCAGAAGLELGVALAAEVRVVAHVEREAAAVECLLARMQEGALEQAPVWDDLCTFDGRPWRGVVDLVTAGFPCQPVSVAGQQRGTSDERWLWNHVWRIVREVGAELLFVENVPGLLGRPFDAVLGSLATSGWSAEWDCVPAASVGAPHRRDRLFSWLPTPTATDARSSGSAASSTASGRHNGKTLTDQMVRLPTPRARDWRHGGHDGIEERLSTGASLLSPSFVEWDDGLAESVDRDRLHVLGNGVVPQAAAAAFTVLIGRLTS